MYKINLTRRSFLSAAAVASATAALSSCSKKGASPALVSQNAPANAGKIEKIRSSCRGCGKMECGVWVTVKDGRAIKIEGDETCPTSRGNCCTKSMSSLQACYHPDRLKYPMKRTNPKGKDPGWVRISWDEALTTSVNKFKEIHKKYGGESIFGMCGTSRIWSMAPYASFKQLVETPNAVVAYQICKGPRHWGTQMTDLYASAWMATVDRPKVYVQWGAAPEISNYDDSGRTTVDAMMEAEHHIVVNPRLQNTGTHADIWLPLRPGTDSALALAWTDVLIKNKLYDDAFVRRWTNGPFLYVEDLEPSGFPFPGRGEIVQIKTRLLKESDIKEGGDPKKFMVWDELSHSLKYFDAETGYWEGEKKRPLAEGVPQKNGGVLLPISKFDPLKKPAIFGSYPVKLKNGKTVKAVPVFQLLANRADAYAPEKSEKITGVPSEKVIKAAKIWAGKPLNGGIQYELGMEQSGNAMMNVRSLAVLTGISGNFDTPAGNRGPTFSQVNPLTGEFAFGTPPVPLSQYEKILGGQKFPLLKWWGKWADANSVWDAVHTGKPYPVKACFHESGSFFNMTNAHYAGEAMKKLEFQLSLELWHSVTSETADILMPVLHWLEVDCPRVSQGSSGGMGATCAAVKPLAECRHDAEIVQDLFKKWGKPWTKDPKNPWPGLEGELDICVKASGMTWKEYRAHFQEHGWWDQKKVEPEAWGTYRRYENGQLRPGKIWFLYGDGKPGFATPTMKMELWSTLIETKHPGQGLELPKHLEPFESPVSQPELNKEYPLTMITGRRIPVYFHSEHRQLPWCRELWPVPKMEIHPDTAAKLGLKQGDWAWIENERGRVRQTVDIYAGIAPNVINAEHAWWYPEKPAPDHGFHDSNINILVNRYAQCVVCGASTLRGYPVKVYKAQEGAPEGIIQNASDKRLKQWLPTYEGRG